MRKARNEGHYQAPLMSAFREAFEAHDARDNAVRVVDGERVIEGRNSRQRRGDEPALKRDLSVDLVALLNTINLASTIPLDGLDYVRDSVLNYGLPDITHLTSEEVGVDGIRDQLAHVLTTFEPRLISETISVDKEIRTNEVDQRVQFTVAGEMFCTPVDVAVNFVAELEISSGKVNLTRLPA
jgi:type VI secretion system protein ImpF